MLIGQDPLAEKAAVGHRGAHGPGARIRPCWVTWGLVLYSSAEDAPTEGWNEDRDGGWLHTATSSCHFVLIRLVTMEQLDYGEEDRAVLLKACGCYGEHSRLPQAKAQDLAQMPPPVPTQLLEMGLKCSCLQTIVTLFVQINQALSLGMAGRGLLQVGAPTQQPGLTRPKLSAKVARACCPRQGPLCGHP